MSDSLIEEHVPLARRIAFGMKQQLSDRAELDDVLGDALCGLVAAADAFDEERGVPFGAYAALRIRGHVIDGLRRRDVVKRRSNWDTDDVRLQPALRLDAPLDGDLTLQDSLPDRRDDVALWENRELVDWLLRRLSPDERFVVVGMLWGDASETELAEQRGVTPGRISQIYNAALHQMRLDLFACDLGSARASEAARKVIRRRARKRELSSVERAVLFAGVG